MRLSFRFRWALYAVFAALFVTGTVWLAADAWKDQPDGELWQSIAANLLMVHGGAAMVVLLMLGALAPLHVQRSWRAGKNRVMGGVMVTCTAVLIVTAFGLYYAGSDLVRPWMSRVHYGLGLALPILLTIHIWWGRRPP